MMYLVIGKLPNITIYRCPNNDNLETIDREFYLEIIPCYQIGDIEKNTNVTSYFINRLDKKYIKYNTFMTMYNRLFEAQKHAIYRIFA